MTGISAAVRAKFLERAGNRCEYCGLSQTGQEATFHVDHIVPRSSGGPTVLDNLALACVSCSLRKWANEFAIDPESGSEVPLFNPRKDRWNEHFRWQDVRVVPLTSIGRATATALALNRDVILSIREEERFRRRHPPPEKSSAARPQAAWHARWLKWALAGYWLLLFVGTHVPIDPQVAVPGNDKTLHFVGYGILALLLGLVVFFQSPRPRREGEGQGEGLSASRNPQTSLQFLIAFVILAIYGGFDELTQPLVGRFCDLWDWLADCGGIAIGLTLAATASRWWNRAGNARTVIAFSGDSTPQSRD